jgi:membrane-associated phospholipid phosphatase
VIFGRSGPDFTFVRDGIYEFRWFTGEWTPFHGAFPSATAAVSSAIAAALWWRGSSHRITAIVIAATLSAAVVVQQYHWFSDAIAGAALGVAIAGGVLFRPGLAAKISATYTPL